MEMTIPELVKHFKYKPLPPVLSKQYRDSYIKRLPNSIKSLGGDLNCEIYVPLNTKISNGYNRIVVGDYGAFIEIKPTQIVIDSLIVMPGEEYRLQKNYRDTVKYFCFCPKGWLDTKIYFQQKTVSYADYQPLMFYVSPHEVYIRSI